MASTIRPETNLHDRDPRGAARAGLGPLLPVAAILLAVVFWGGSFAAMRLAVLRLDPWSVTWARMAIALAALLPFARRLRWGGYRPGDWKWLGLTALLQPCLYFLLEAHALTLTTSSQAGVISASVPLLVAAGAGWALAERVAPGTFVGLMVALAGVLWLTLSGASAGAGTNPLLGNALELGAMVCAAAYMLLVKRLTSRYSPWTLTALQILAGALFFLPGAPALFRGGLAGLGAGGGVALLYLGACVTLGAFGLYNYGISRIPASRASAFINLVPVVAVLLSWVVLGETLAPAQCLAAGLVVAGVLLSQRRPAARAAGAAAAPAGTPTG